MADKPEVQVTPELEKDANSRLADCRRQKALWDLDIREAYFFTDPQRARSISSNSSSTDTRPNDAAELQTSIGMECSEDFTTEALNAFMPQTGPWAERRQGPMVPDEVWAEVKDRVVDDDARIFESIKASNLYEAAAQGFTPDLAVGTIGLWIEDLRPAEPTVCQTVPIRELEINVGPTGAVDDRWIIRNTKHRHIATLLPGIDLPPDLARKVKDKPNQKCQVRWGFWRDWSDKGDVVWIFVNMVGDKLVHAGKLTGEGSCPLIVARFNPDPMYAFGRGPAIKALPELRTIDEVDGMFTRALGHAVDPSFIYPSDSMLNFEGGIEEGMGYAGRMGGERIEWLVPQRDAQFAEFGREEKERRIKRLFFVDRPEQRGDTPPTATQWLDEMMLAQRRLGTPGMTFWREGPAEIFLRFKFVMEKRGAIQPLTVNGKVVSLQPMNPAQRSADLQEFQLSVRVAQTAIGVFPTEAQATIDGTATIQNWQKKVGDRLIAFRKPEEVAGLLQTFANAGQPQGAGTVPAGAPVA